MDNSRAGREIELHSWMATEQGRSRLMSLYEKLYTDGLMAPVGTLVKQDMIRAILAKEFPDYKVIG